MLSEDGSRSRTTGPIRRKDTPPKFPSEHSTFRDHTMSLAFALLPEVFGVCFGLLWSRSNVKRESIMSTAHDLEDVFPSKD